MCIYEVRAIVQAKVYPQYLEWLKTEHVKEVLACPGFISADICVGKFGVALESSSIEIKVIYKLRDETALKEYLSHRAMALREKGLQKFPGEFSAQREMWKEVFTFTA